MAIIDTIENDPAILAELQGFHRGEEVDLSDRALEMLDLLTAEDPCGQDGVSVSLGRKEKDEIDKHNDILYKTGPIKVPIEVVQEDFEDPEAVYAFTRRR